MGAEPGDIIKLTALTDDGRLGLTVMGVKGLEVLAYYPIDVYISNETAKPEFLMQLGVVRCFRHFGLLRFCT